jgi:hypothetical protein
MAFSSLLLIAHLVVAGQRLVKLERHLSCGDQVRPFDELHRPIAGLVISYCPRRRSAQCSRASIFPGLAPQRPLDALQPFCPGAHQHRSDAVKHSRRVAQSA